MEPVSTAANAPGLGKRHSDGERLPTRRTHTHTCVHTYTYKHAYIHDRHLLNDGLLFKQGALLKLASLSAA